MPKPTAEPADARALENLLRVSLAEASFAAPLDRVLVGYSGGADSTALLAAAVTVVGADFPQCTLMALHVNHGLHAEAGLWQQHCEMICARLGVTLATVAVEVPRQGNMEANARRCRYAAFAAHMTPSTFLLLGHHQHDQTETILYRLFQGRGLLPMRESGPLGAGRFARPLLSVTPEHMRAYLALRGLTWIEDDSNRDRRLARNFLRADVLPLLARRWHKLHEAVSRVVSSQAAVQAALVHALQRAGNVVPLADLPAGPARVAWLRAYLHGRGVYDVSDKALLAFVSDLEGARSARLPCGSGMSLQAYDGHLHWLDGARAARQSATADTLTPGEELQLRGGRLLLRPAAAGEDLAMRVDGPLCIRYRRGGERLRMADHRKSVKQLFMQAKVPPWQRDAYPLLYRGDELVCIPGVAVAASAAPGSTAGQTADEAALWVAQWQIDGAET